VPVSNPREAQTKPYTTVAFDYGKLSLDGYDIYLFGTPGQTRLQFMWKVLSVGMHGYIYVVDGSSLVEVIRGKTLYEYMKTLGSYPHVVAVNKQDVRGAVPPKKVAEVFNIDPSLVSPLVAYDRSSALEVVRKFLRVYSREVESLARKRAIY